MKLSENWLREWVQAPLSGEALTSRITLAGLESEASPLLDEMPSGVVVGRIVSIAPHPNADKLRVCEVDVGQAGMPTIVCGAANARAGLVAPVALPGARLPGGVEIGASELRGVASGGMLCSAKELGLAEKSDGLMELDADARAGMPFEQYLGLRDTILNLELTPNRGDCLSIQGLAREVAAQFGLQLTRPRPKPAVVVVERRYAVEIENLAQCPNYAGRVVARINPKARTPDWMREKLRRSGIRAIHPIVDITQYVMLELGQPMHAFDCAKLSGNIKVRQGREGERLRLLNEQEIEITPADLLIADDTGPLALAGVMGGAESGVSASTVNVFFESACFASPAVALTGRRHKLNSDALYRYERGVDPELQRVALERATELAIAICGGEAGPITHTGRTQPEPVKVRLRHARVKSLLGHDIPVKEIEALLARLGIQLSHADTGTWNARIPSYRYDLRIEADLIEEVARLYGYDRIPAQPYRAALAPAPLTETQRELPRVKNVLVARGYYEAVNLAFVDDRLQRVLSPDAATIPLDNPIAENLGVMRSSLWSGLVGAWLYNRSRQAERVRLFEAGVCFADDAGRVHETSRIAGLVTGNALPEQWGGAARPVDFYDLKADVVALLGVQAGEYRFVADVHPALHPGRSARILRGAQPVGWLGALHPQAVRALDLPATPYVFELDWAPISAVAVPHAQALSEYPRSRRDLAPVVPEAVTAQALCDVARKAGGAALHDVFVFDVYRGPGIAEGCKSVSLGLIFQNLYRTLNQDEIDTAAQSVAADLKQELGASIRT